MTRRWMGRETNQSLILICFNPSVFCVYFSACCWSVRLSESIQSPPQHFPRWEVWGRGGACSQRGWPWRKSDDLRRAVISIIIEKLISSGALAWGWEQRGGWMRREDSGGYNCMVEGGVGCGWGVHRRTEGNREGKTVGALGRWRRQWG